MLYSQFVKRGLLLLPHQKSFLFAPGVSHSRIPLNFIKLLSTVSYNNYIFKLDYFPRSYYGLVLTGKEAADFELLKSRLDSVLDYSNKDKIRFAFGSIDIIPVHNFESSLFKYLCILKNFFMARYQKIYYYKEGIEVIYSPSGICNIINMIKHVIVHQGKDPELIYIMISF